VKVAEKSIFRRRSEARAKAAPEPVDRWAWVRGVSFSGAGWQVVLGLSTFILVVYAYALWHRGFGPELAMFYLINSGLSFGEMLSKYTEFHNQWYRPTAFHLIYWLGSHLFAWNNIVAWKLAQIVFLVAACWVQYLFTLEFLGNRKLAAWLSAIFVATFPGQVTIVLQTSAFDLPHIAFAMLTAILFARALRAPAKRKWMLIAASCLSFAAALTCKESTLVLPLFLTILMLMRGSKRDWAALAPHFAILGAYVYLHLMQMPSRGADDAYRTGFNLDFILRNLWSFPLWTARVFALTAHPSQVYGLNTVLNNTAGLAILGITARYWARERSARTTMLLMLAWIVIMLLIPIYSGAYLWHVNLAVCGYAVLAGAALASFAAEAADYLKMPSSRIVAAGTVLFLLAGVYAVFNTLNVGIHAGQYRLIAGLRADSSKLPAAVSKDTLVYIEDRNRMGTWSYGGGDNLVKFHYMMPKLEEKTVPAMNEIPWELRYEWLRRPNAIFLRQDDQLHWYDGSKDFRTASIGSLTAYTGKLIEERKWLHLIALLEACFREPEARDNYLLQYHYAFALHNCERTSDAIAAYSRSIALQSDFYYTLLNRGNAYRQTGRTAEACGDYRRAAQTPGAHADIQDTLRQYCR